MSWLDTLDLRWLSALCHGFIGVSLVAVALRVWWMPLHQRAVAFEPYLTGKGVAAMLNAWPAVFIAGMLLVVAGISKWVYYARWHGSIHDQFASGVGLAEAIFSVWAACSVAVVTVRAWRGN